MKKTLFKVLGAILVFMFLLQTNIVYAVTQKDLNESNQKIKETKEELNEIKEEKSETMKQVEELNSKISEYQVQIDELDGKISSLNTKISEAESQIEKKEQDYSENQKLLEDRLVATYEAGETSYLDVILASNGITDLISNYYLVTEVATNDAELLERIQNEKKEIEEAKESLVSSKEELATSKASKQSIATQLKSSKAEKDSYVAKLSSEEKETQSQLEQLQAENEQINRQLKEAEARYRAQLEALRNKQQGGSASSNSSSSDTYNSGGSGVLQRPVNSGSITTRMYYSSGRYHGALDYGVPVGTTVYAAADGVVLQCTSISGSYGNYIVIQHTNGLRTWYAHGNGVFYVSPGQTVSRGQAIMQSGNSGNSTGPHLHFEVRVSPYNYSYSGNDSRRNPENYF